MRVLQYLKCSGIFRSFTAEESKMSTAFQGNKGKPQWIHVVRPMPGVSEKIPHYLAGEVECAFPELFQFLVVLMFLMPNGYAGSVDDKQSSISGNYYGLSWGCVHRDCLPLWQHYAKNVRQSVYQHCWQWLRSCGRTSIIDPGYRRETFLAFFDPLPIGGFIAATEKLIRDGFFRIEVEIWPENGQEFDVLYPTQKLIDRLSNAQYE